MIDDTPKIARYHWLPCKNKEADKVIPPFALMQVFGVDEGEIVKVGLTVDQVLDTPRVFVFNSMVEIPKGGYGQCSFDLPGWVLCDPARQFGPVTTPATGEEYGPLTGSWMATFAGAGGLPNVDKGFMVVGGGTSAVAGGRAMVKATASPLTVRKGLPNFPDPSFPSEIFLNVEGINFFPSALNSDYQNSDFEIVEVSPGVIRIKMQGKTDAAYRILDDVYCGNGGSFVKIYKTLPIHNGVVK